jgi:endonuclease YncB( thermonuclease family)
LENIVTELKAVTVVRWIDGDTFHAVYRADVTVPATIQLPWQPGRDIKIELRGIAEIPVVVRCDGINAPELHGATKAAGLASKKFAEKLAPPQESVSVQTSPLGDDKFGRWLGTIQLLDGRDFGAAMIAAGHAVEYHGGKR